MKGKANKPYGLNSIKILLNITDFILLLNQFYFSTFYFYVILHRYTTFQMVDISLNIQNPSDLIYGL